MTGISIILPVWNEARALPEALAALRALDADLEIIVVDAGSAGGSAEIARALGADRVLEASLGRGHQMRVGAAAASGAALLFLHVDCRLPAAAPALIVDTLGAGFDGGVFRVRHVPSSAAGPLGCFFLRLADLRARGLRLPYGDQAMFLSREAYHQAGGMPEQPLMEDIELSRRLRRGGYRIRRLREEVQVSARRLEQTPLRTLLCWSTFPTLYSLGVPAERLHRWYGAAMVDS